MSKHLHIVTHDVPWPADFGGVIDLYYKLKWLHEAGIKIHLHCFIKNRPAQPALEKYCETVNYYRRKTLGGISFKLPYIVSSRNSRLLLQNLKKDNYPILLEGIHCTYHLSSGSLKDRKIFLRLHNVEYKYYENLALSETIFLKKLYFKNEARLLHGYEKKIATNVSIWAVSEEDKELYKREFGAKDIHFLPVFLPWDEVSAKEGTGTYCLYHGNLSVSENEKAAEWLIKNIFQNPDIPFIVAGRAPSEKLKTLIQDHAHISLTENPGEEKMEQLIANAQVNVLPSFNKTGVKLKLLNALYNGRHCLVNLSGCEGSGLNNVCNIAETGVDFKNKVMRLSKESFTEKEMQHRSTALKNLYNNELSARRIIAWIW